MVNEEKAIQQTSITNGHRHTYNDSESGNTSINAEHSHAYIVSEDGRVRILESLITGAHIHEPAAINKNQKLSIKKIVSFNIQNVKQERTDDGEFGFFEGYASTFHNIDLSDDVILPGAFQKTINSGRKISMFWSHSSSNTIGRFLSIKEDNIGLFVQGRINLGVQRGREAFALLKAGDIHSMSIGFNFFSADSVIEDGIRTIKELDLFEISLVAIPANPQAVITDIKTVVPFQDLPLADRDRPWDSRAAIRRVREFTDSEDSPSSKYKNAFLWFDNEASDNFGSYKLPFADVVDGTLKAVPRGIFAAAAVLQGARGGVDIAESDQEKIRRNLSKYYRKMDLVAPWDRDNGKALILEEINLSEKLKDIEKILKINGFDKTESKALIATIKQLSQRQNVEKAEREAEMLKDNEEIQMLLKSIDQLIIRLGV